MRPGPVDLRDGGVLVAVFPRFLDTRTGGVGIYARDRTVRMLLEGDMRDVLAIAPDGEHALVARERSDGVNELLAVPFDGSPPQSLAPSGIAPQRGLALSGDGRSVAWSTCRRIVDVAELDRSGNAEPFGPTGEWRDVGVARIPGTQSIVVVSDRGGHEQPWVVDVTHRAPPRQVDLGPENVLYAAVSHDGRLLAYALDGFGIGVVPLDGSAPPRLLARGRGLFSPTFLRDGKTLLFTALDAQGAPRVSSIALTGDAAPVDLLEPGSRSPVACPTDDEVAYLTGESPETLVAMSYSLHTHVKRRVAPAMAPTRILALQYSPDGRRIGIAFGTSAFDEVDAATGAVMRHVALSNLAEPFAFTYVDDRIVFTQQRWAGGLWLADDPF
jgi:Tol biopolymer transport system component